MNGWESEMLFRRERNPALSSLGNLNLRQRNLFGLKPLRAVLYDKGHTCAFIQSAIAVLFNRREVDEDILSVLSSDKSEALGGIEPLNSSSFFHA